MSDEVKDRAEPRQCMLALMRQHVDHGGRLGPVERILLVRANDEALRALTQIVSGS